MTRNKGANGMHVAMPQKPCVYGRGGMGSKNGGMMNKKGGKY